MVSELVDVLLDGKRSALTIKLHLNFQICSIGKWIKSDSV